MTFKNRLFLTVLVAITIWSLLAWNYTHGGVPSHHILARADLPSISNWWGALLLPALTWFLLFRIKKRYDQNITGHSQQAQIPPSVAGGFTAALAYGVLLAVFFSFGQQEICGYMVNLLLLLALLYPIYRAECLFGFVLGMTFTFGAVLPTMIGSIMVLIAFILYNYLRPMILFLSRKVWRLVVPVKL